ncbi:ABC transporter permease [Streptosporangium sp. 'caverna']|jgi:ABC-type dipeptide/oligopeptide/nickel transport system permease subunit|uniref:ABC transporter permease n=1 Tax=Streptosporangium sp. 'caverna' TaxID=2202249 RepID=UPI000D7E100A|nr:ABC transporter permease [Streptosporangium sp. 'caverna']AWS42611.1 ABC transporter permease [Streptosporangium sp. 'caverna']
MSLSQAEEVLAGDAGDGAGGSLGRDAWRRLRRNPVAITGAILVFLFVAVALLAPWLAPFPPDKPVGQVTPTSIPGPSAEHWFGLDDLGRDEFTRILWGARWSLVIGVVSLLLGMTGGLLLGLLAGAFGGVVDTVVMRFVDMVLAIPGLLFAIGVAAMLGSGLEAVMIAIAVVNVPIFARLLRGQMLAQRQSDYVLAATSVGVRRRRIVLGHILPNSLTPVIVQGTLTLATAIVDAAGLAFLGLSSNDPSIPEWGRMLADTQRYLSSAPLLAVFPGLAIIFAALGFTLLGESLREALDPKYRR